MAKFDAESPDYDWDSVKAWEKETGGNWEDYATLIPNPKTGKMEKHYASRLPSGENEGLLLKGKQHESWNLLEEGEKEAGMKIYKKGKRYYSKPKNISDKIIDMLKGL